MDASGEIALLIFFSIFSVALAVIWHQSASYVDAMSNLPLVDDSHEVEER